MEFNGNDYTSEKAKDIKIILLGDTGVGKTSIINRFINSKFDPFNENTIASTFSTKEIIKNDVMYRMNLWDTMGQEKYKSITDIFIKGSNIVILVYSVDSLTSLENLDYWYNSLKKILIDDKYILAIIGNKSDLIMEGEAVVSEEEGRKYAEGKNAKFKLISSKEDSNEVNNFFIMLLEELLKLNYVVVTESFRIKRGEHKDSIRKNKKENKNCCKN